MTTSTYSTGWPLYRIIPPLPTTASASGCCVVDPPRDRQAQATAVATSWRNFPVVPAAFELCVELIGLDDQRGWRGQYCRSASDLINGDDNHLLLHECVQEPPEIAKC